MEYTTTESQKPQGVEEAGYKIYSGGGWDGSQDISVFIPQSREYLACMYLLITLQLFMFYCSVSWTCFG